MLSRIWRRQLTDLTKGQIKARLERSSVTLIDVRRFDEVDAGVIETPQGGKWIHIPLNELEEALELDNDDFAAQFECDQKPDKNDELIFYCMKGVRSASAALYFEQNVSSKNNFESPLQPDICILVLDSSLYDWQYISVAMKTSDLIHN